MGFFSIAKKLAPGEQCVALTKDGQGPRCTRRVAALGAEFCGHHASKFARIEREARQAGRQEALRAPLPPAPEAEGEAEGDRKSALDTILMIMENRDRPRDDSEGERERPCPSPCGSEAGGAAGLEELEPAAVVPAAGPAPPPALEAPLLPAGAEDSAPAAEPGPPSLGRALSALSKKHGGSGRFVPVADLVSSFRSRSIRVARVEVEPVCALWPTPHAAGVLETPEQPALLELPDCEPRGQLPHAPSLRELIAMIDADRGGKPAPPSLEAVLAPCGWAQFEEPAPLRSPRPGRGEAPPPPKADSVSSLPRIAGTGRGAAAAAAPPAPWEGGGEARAFEGHAAALVEAALRGLPGARLVRSGPAARSLGLGGQPLTDRALVCYPDALLPALELRSRDVTPALTVESRALEGRETVLGRGFPLAPRLGAAVAVLDTYVQDARSPLEPGRVERVARARDISRAQAAVLLLSADAAVPAAVVAEAGARGVLLVRDDEGAPRRLAALFAGQLARAGDADEHRALDSAALCLPWGLLARFFYGEAR